MLFNKSLEIISFMEMTSYPGHKLESCFSDTEHCFLQSCLGEHPT